MLVVVDVCVGRASSRVNLDEETMRALPGEACLALMALAKRLDSSAEVQRLVYQDDEGDMCTFTACTLEDALGEAKAVTQGGREIKMLRLAAVLAAKTQAPLEHGGLEPLARNEEAAAAPLPPPALATPAPAAPAPPAPAAAAAEQATHHGVVCDRCGVQPIRGTRYSKRGADYDLCEADFQLLPTCERKMFVEVKQARGGAPRWQQGAPTDRDACRVALACLLSHPDADVKAAAALAVKDALRQENAKPTEPVKPSGPVHRGVACDMCDAEPIVGVRYKRRWANYDLCEKDYQTLPEDAKDLFVRIEEPMSEKQVLALEANGQVHYNVTCDMTNVSPIVGTRYKKYGQNYDLCEAAFQQLSEEERKEYVAIERPEDKFEALARAKAEREACKAAAAEQPSAASGEVSVVMDEQTEASSELTAGVDQMCDAEGEAPAVADEQREASDEMLAVADEQSEASGDTPVLVEEPLADFMLVDAGPSAKALASTLGVCNDDAAAEDPTARGDVTHEFASLLQQHPHISQVYRIGRVVLHHSTQASIKAKVYVRNEGSSAWPAEAEMRIVAGAPHGFEQMDLGAVPAGDTVELVLDMHVAPGEEGQTVRSIWSLSAHGEPFGPLLAFEIAYM